MKQFILFTLTLLSSTFIMAQAPSNDDCAGLINLGVAPACPTTIFTNAQATNSNIGNDNNPTCFQNNLATRDVWFSFTCPPNVIDFRVTITGTATNGIRNPQVAIYRGDCIYDNLAEYECAKSNPGQTEVFIDLPGLTPNLPYFIRVSDYPTSGVPNAGNFNICVDTIPDVTTIDAGSTTVCNGTIYDTGGEFGNYGPNEDHTFTICPAAPSACIDFTLEYYNMEEGDGFTSMGESLTFYDGPNTNSPEITTLSGAGFFLNQSGGGGVCFRVTASSGCLTMRFKSDEAVQFEGFKGTWSCSSTPCTPLGVVQIDPTVTQTELVNALATPNNTVTVTSIKCPQGSYGRYGFANQYEDLGIGKGIILTSGLAILATGPNTEPDASEDNLAPGDADLDYLSNILGSGEESLNACVVELDVFVRSDELTFEYVFGSEEYPEFVNESFNDIFAFLISGPGIVGDPNLGGAKNIAVLPDGNDTPVQINSVNNLLNWSFYRNNQIGQSVQYDGLTSDVDGVKKSLTARSKVIPCQTYHLKLAIADRDDEIYDSGVFIAEIQSGAPELKVQFVTGLDYFTESCAPAGDLLLIRLTQPSNDTLRYNTSISGSATLGVDYTLNLPSQLVFLPGQTELAFPITPISDNIPEQTETIQIALTNNFGCGPVTYTNLVVEIKDNVDVEVTGGDTLFVCEGATLQLQATGATGYFWQPTGAVSNPFLSNPTITPTANIWLQVTGTLGTCTDVDYVYVRVVNPVIDVLPNGPVAICSGESLQLNCVNNVNNMGLVWSPAQSLSDPNIPNPVATPTESTLYVATVTIAGCSAKDTLRVLVDTLFTPVLTTTDTTVCQNYPVVLAAPLASTSTYLWSPAAGLSATNIANPIATPDFTTTYTVITTSANNACRDTAKVKINVIPADINIIQADTTFICLGSSVPLNAVVSPAGGSAVTWSPSFFVSPITGPSTTVTPDESTWVYARYFVNGCQVVDSVYIRVDSIPANEITAQPAKPFYCPGDTIYLISPTYEPASFPDIQLYWPPMMAGEQTPDSLWNMVLTAQEGTHTLVRYIRNNACSDTSSITILVAKPVTLTISGDTELCIGESTQLTVTSDPPGVALEWKDNTAGLSCTNCPNPTATPTVTTTYTVTAKDGQCPSDGNITINVTGATPIQWPDPLAVCPGGSVTLNGATSPGTTYNWSGPGITNPANPFPTVQPTATSTYSVTVTSNIGCTRIESKTIELLNGTINAGPNKTICNGTTTTLTATTTGTPGNIIWQPGGKTGATIETDPVFGSADYVATLVYGGVLECKSSDTVRISTFSPVVGIEQITLLDSIQPEQTICFGSTVRAKVATTPPNLPVTWLLNGVAQTVTTPTASLIPPLSSSDTAADVTIRARVQDANGCVAQTNEVIIRVRRCFDLPNAFTPNGDNENDTFGPVNPFNNFPIPVQEFKIFNRWGDAIWQAEPGQPRWDGRVNGKEAPVDTYIYHILVQYPNGVTDIKRGEVTVLR